MLLATWGEATATEAAHRSRGSKEEERTSEGRRRRRTWKGLIKSNVYEDVRVCTRRFSSSFAASALCPPIRCSALRCRRIASRTWVHHLLGEGVRLQGERHRRVARALETAQAEFARNKRREGQQAEARA